MNPTLASFLSTVAPTIASAVLGPLGGVAVAGIAKIFGLDGATVEDVTKHITDGRMTPEQLAAIKQLEMQYQNDERERQFKYSELEFKDVDSARNREVQVKDNTNKILAYLIVVAFITMVGTTLAGWTQVESVLAGTLIGYLSAKCEQVLSYYFGSNKSSARKTELIAQGAPVETK